MRALPEAGDLISRARGRRRWTGSLRSGPASSSCRARSHRGAARRGSRGARDPPARGRRGAMPLSRSFAGCSPTPRPLRWARPGSTTTGTTRLALRRSSSSARRSALAADVRKPSSSTPGRPKRTRSASSRASRDDVPVILHCFSAPASSRRARTRLLRLLCGERHVPESSGASPRGSACRPTGSSPRPTARTLRPRLCEAHRTSRPTSSSRSPRWPRHVATAADVLVAAVEANAARAFSLRDSSRVTPNGSSASTF